VKAAFVHITLNFLYITLLLVAPSGGHAQQHSFKFYDVNDGLPSTTVGGVYQDRYGYLWVSTSAGLSRFDGRQFVNFSFADGLPSLGVGAALQDSKDRFWIATNAGMAEFKNNKIITFPTSDNQNFLYVFNFVETKDGHIWALTGRGVYEFAESYWKKISLCPGFENSACRNIVEINRELYINYANDIVCRNKEGHWLHIASQQDYGSIFNIMSVQNKQVWISTIKNIYIIRDYQLVPIYKKDITTKNFFSYHIDSKKRLWLEGEEFLKISRPNDWQHFPDSINKHGYNSFVKEDSSHNIWTGTTEGLLKVKDIAFTVIDKNNTIPLDGIYNIIALPDNRLIFSSGSKTGLLLYADNSCKQIMPPKAPGNENYYRDPVDAYTFDDKNSLWMITRFRRFLRFNGKTLEDFSATLHLKTHEFIYDLNYVKNRHQFFVCADSTLLYGNSSKLSTFIPANTGVPIVKPTRLLGLKNGLLLLYIARKGVYYIDEANNLISLVKEIGTDGGKNWVHLYAGFYEDSGNNLWIAVSGLGLYQYGFTNKKQLFLKNHLTIKNGLQSNNVLSLTNDGQDRLWVASNAGLDILQMNKSGNWEVFNYVKPVDLTISAIDYEKLVCDADGNVWLSSPNKIVKFNTDSVRLDKETPHIIIEKVALAFKETDWSKLTDSLYTYFQLPFNPVLNYSQNSLGILFNAIDLSTSNSNPEYSYKLLPLDTSWSIPSKIKSVSFAQLPAGKYQFMVRAKDLASGWSKPAVFGFTINPPFWNKWWFRIIILTVAALIIISIFKARIRKIRSDASIENQLKELEMKALKAQMNPHFIYNALNSIQALVANDKKEEGVHYIGSFSRLLRQVLDNSENNVISLDKELETIGLYIQLEALRLDMQLHYQKIVPENIVTEFEKIPPLILQPFVENALWHGLSRKAGEKEIKITVSLNDAWLICDITDNGIGRKKVEEYKENSTAVHQSRGIEITRKRLIDFNEDELVTPIEFFDLCDDKKNPLGTQVTVRIKRKFNSISI
jgi:ligand-binding sensor domain-containing protein